MLFIFCVVFCFTVVKCLEDKGLQYGLKDPFKQPNSINVDEVREKLYDKLRTVENEPQYDYKDMWWKTLTDIISTTKTITTQKKSNGGGVLYFKRFTVKTNEKPDNKTAVTKAIVKKLQLTAFNDVNDIKQIPEKNVTGNVDNISNNSVTTNDVDNKNVTVSHHGREKVILPLTNDSKVIESIQKVEADNFKREVNQSLDILKEFPGLNDSRIMNYYNFTAQHFGDAGLVDPGTPDNPDLKRTTWHILLHSDNTDWLTPSDKETKEPSTPAYVTLPTVMASTTPDFLAFLEDYKTTTKEGYFSTFLANFFKVISEKPGKDVYLLGSTLVREVANLKKEMFIYDFGPEFVEVLENFSVSVMETDVDYTIAYSLLLSSSVKSRQDTIAPGVAHIIDYIDSMFNDQEGKELFKALDLVEKYPNTTGNVFEVTRKVSKAVFAPYIRHSGTMTAVMLVEAIKGETQKAKNTSSSVIVEETGQRSKKEEEGEKEKEKSQRRLNIFNNKTRFAVVRREPSYLVYRTTKKDDDRGYSLSYYEIKSKKGVSGFQLTRFDPVHGGRYKIMTRSTPRKIRLLPPTYSTTKRQIYSQKKYYPPKNKYYNQPKRTQEQYIERDISYTDNDIIKYRPQFNQLNRKTIKITPIANKHSTTSYSIYYKRPRYTTRRFNQTRPEKRYSQAKKTKDFQKTKDLQKSTKYRPRKGPIKKIIIVKSFPTSKSKSQQPKVEANEEEEILKLILNLTTTKSIDLENDKYVNRITTKLIEHEYLKDYSIELKKPVEHVSKKYERFITAKINNREYKKHNHKKYDKITTKLDHKEKYDTSAPSKSVDATHKYDKSKITKLIDHDYDKYINLNVKYNNIDDSETSNRIDREYDDPEHKNNDNFETTKYVDVEYNNFDNSKTSKRVSGNYTEYDDFEHNNNKDDNVITTKLAIDRVDNEYLEITKSVEKEHSISSHFMTRTRITRDHHDFDSIETTKRIDREKYSSLITTKLDDREYKYEYDKPGTTQAICDKNYNRCGNIKPKGNFAFKANVKEYEQITEDVKHPDSKKILEASSYSDEEEAIKFNLNDALKHDVDYLRVARRSNHNFTTKKNFNQLSSYSDEEERLKSKIYNIIGFKHARNTPFSDILGRAGDEKAAVKKTTQKFKAINDDTSYSDEEVILRKRLYNY